MIIPSFSPDKKRLTELYRTYGPAIYARCRRLLGEAAGAEDAVQETFLRVARHIHRAPNEDEALAWIYRIATNYCLNVLRDRRGKQGSAAALEFIADVSFEEALINHDLARRIVADVPEDIRDVGWLHFVDGLDQSDVARVLGISRRTVVSRVGEFRRYALRTLGQSQVSKPVDRGSQKTLSGG